MWCFLTAKVFTISSITLRKIFWKFKKKKSYISTFLKFSELFFICILIGFIFFLSWKFLMKQKYLGVLGELLPVLLHSFKWQTHQKKLEGKIIQLQGNFQALFWFHSFCIGLGVTKKWSISKFILFKLLSKTLILFSLKSLKYLIPYWLLNFWGSPPKKKYFIYYHKYRHLSPSDIYFVFCLLSLILDSFWIFQFIFQVSHLYSLRMYPSSNV